MRDSGVVIGRLGPFRPVRSASATFVGGDSKLHIC